MLECIIRNNIRHHGIHAAHTCRLPQLEEISKKLFHTKFWKITNKDYCWFNNIYCWFDNIKIVKFVNAFKHVFIVTRTIVNSTIHIVDSTIKIVSSTINNVDSTISNCYNNNITNVCIQLLSFSIWFADNVTSQTTFHALCSDIYCSENACPIIWNRKL